MFELIATVAILFLAGAFATVLCLGGLVFAGALKIALLPVTFAADFVKLVVALIVVPVVLFIVVPVVLLVIVPIVLVALVPAILILAVPIMVAGAIAIPIIVLRP